MFTHFARDLSQGFNPGVISRWLTSFPYTIFTLPVKPRSSSICRISVSKLRASWPSTVTENSIPILRSEPLFSFGNTFVPNRFQISGGTLPAIRNVFRVVGGSGSGFGSGSSTVSGTNSDSVVGLDPEPPPGSGSGLAVRALAFDFKSKKTPDSKVTSAGSMDSL